VYRIKKTEKAAKIRKGCKAIKGGKGFGKHMVLFWTVLRSVFSLPDPATYSSGEEASRYNFVKFSENSLQH
jgi:hypothetical protein